MNFLLDTNVVSEGSRQPVEPAVARWFSAVDEDETFVSVVSVAEIRQGIAALPASKRKEALWSWMQSRFLVRYQDRLLDVSLPIAQAWGVLAAEGQRRGRPMPIMDGFLAATARVHSLVVVTRNTRDFEHLGVKCVNPWKF